MSSLNAIIQHHRSENLLDKLPGSRRNACKLTEGILAHTSTHFESIDLRLKNLGKRMESTISLVSDPFEISRKKLTDDVWKSFHLVTQDGNRIMQKDSRSMATIALVTLIFLPMSTVSVSFIELKIPYIETNSPDCLW